MPDVTLTINNNPYRLACGEGEEETLEALGEMLDDKVSEITKAVGQVGDTKLILLAALTLLDEARAENESLGITAGTSGASLAALQAAAQKIDHIAETLESA